VTASKSQMKRLIDLNQAMYSRMFNSWMIGMGSWGWSQDQTNDYYKEWLDRAQMATAENVKAMQNAFAQIKDSQLKLYSTITDSVGAAVAESDMPDIDYITSLTRMVNDLTAQTVTSFSSLSSKAANTATELSAKAVKI